MLVRFDLMAMWNVVVAGALLLGAVVYLTGVFRRSTFEVLKQTSEGWKSAADLKTAEVVALREELAAIKAQLREMQEKYAEVLALNLQLQQKEQQWERERVLWQEERMQMMRRIEDLERRNRQG